MDLGVHLTVGHHLQLVCSWLSLLGLVSACSWALHWLWLGPSTWGTSLHPQLPDHHQPFRGHLRFGLLSAWLGTWMVEAEIKALRDLVSGLHLRVVALEEEVAQLKGRNHDAPASGRASESEFSLVEEVRPSSGYQSLAAQVPPCPSFALGLCSALRGGRLSAIQRAERAWEVGVWAKFTLQGKIAKPRPSQPIDLSNSI